MSDMALNPSNGIAARNNPGRTMFRNLAGNRGADDAVFTELDEAGITAYGPIESHRTHGEVPTAYVGGLCSWGFRRAWYYWVATGPGIPPDAAEEFHKQWGNEVRVEGHCGCPSPLEYNKGFAVGLYHIDTQEGLNAFAKLLNDIHTGE